MDRGVMLGAPLLFTIELTILYAAGYYAMGRLVSISGFGGANGSVLIIMLLHTMNNTISGSFFSPMFSGADSVRQSWLLAAMWCAVAVVVVLRSDPAHLSRQRRKQEEPPKGAPSVSVP